MPYRAIQAIWLIQNQEITIIPIAYILCCECVLLLFLLNRHTAANTVSSMTELSTTPMITPPTHGSGELDTGAVWEQGTDEVWEQDTGVVLTGLAPK